MSKEKEFAVNNDLPLELHRTMQYGAYYMGALMAAKALLESLFLRKPKGEDWIYLKSVFDLVTKNKRNISLFLDGYEIRYRNHRRNKKGKLESVDAYFAEKKTIYIEIK